MTTVEAPTKETKKIPVGISACLLGEKVRYDGGHKKSKLCVDILTDYFDYKQVCPEIAIGLGVPRETIRLVKHDAHIAVENQAGTTNHQLALSEYASEIAAKQTDICGFVVMKDSPSCGMERVKQFNAKGNLQDTRGIGAFTRQLMQEKPWLPVEENGRLNDVALKENFILRVYALNDWNVSVEADLTAANLLGFHSRYKYILMAHSQLAYRDLGRLLSSLKQVDLGAVADLYKSRFMAGLAKPAGRKGNTNVLMHIQGYLKRSLQTADKARLTAVIAQYRKAEVPLIVPVSLLNFLIAQYPNEYLIRQRYLNPYPEALGLRNAI